MIPFSVPGVFCKFDADSLTAFGDITTVQMDDISPCINACSVCRHHLHIDSDHATFEEYMQEIEEALQDKDYTERS